MFVDRVHEDKGRDDQERSESRPFDKRHRLPPVEGLVEMTAPPALGRKPEATDGEQRERRAHIIPKWQRVRDRDIHQDEDRQSGHRPENSFEQRAHRTLLVKVQQRARDPSRAPPRCALQRRICGQEDCSLARSRTNPDQPEKNLHACRAHRSFGTKAARWLQKNVTKEVITGG